jgi:EAL domain-containing protein (putative c-di-GMP-specific phosphodiesterase class I)
MAALEDTLQRHDAGASGAFLIARMEGLAELNQSIGRPAADALLRRIGERLALSAGDHVIPRIVARLNAGDFAVLAPGETEIKKFAEHVLGNIRQALDGTGSVPDFRVGATHYVRDDSRAAVVARADGALSQATQSGSDLAIAAEPAPDAHLPTDLPGWRQALLATLQDNGIRLAHYPVKDYGSRLIHLESPLRLLLGKEWLPAAHFISWATRLDLMPRFDLLVVDAALSAIEASSPAISANLSAEAIRDPVFTAALASKLKQRPESASRLWLEVSEYGALRHVAEFRNFCRVVKPLGCKVGLKHVGRQFSRIAELHDLGIDYLKIDGAIVNGIQDSADQRAFLRSLCTVAHAVGITTIATGVSRSEDLQALSALGIDAFTGPAIRD